MQSMSNKSQQLSATCCTQNKLSTRMWRTSYGTHIQRHANTDHL